MVFVRDEGSLFHASLDDVWKFVGSGEPHSKAHGHTGTRRTPLEGNAGVYSWEQSFRGRPERFTMRWQSYHPLGLAYDVLEGPFSGSHFFLYYEPGGAVTRVSVVGEFVSPSIPEHELAEAVAAFLDLEFEQDRAAIEGEIRAAESGGGRP